MIVIVNNSNRNREILKSLKKSKRMMGSSKKCTLKNNKKTNTIFTTDKLIDYMEKTGIKYKNVVSTKQMKKILADKDKITGIILGGSNLKYSNNLCACSINNNIISLLEFDVPILGICFGFQTMAISHGGSVISMGKMVNSRKKVKLKKSKIFDGMKKEEKFKFMHSDFVNEVPKSFKIIAKTLDGMCQAIKHKEKEIYGVQFHPEISGKVGEDLLNNFLKICKKSKV